MSADERVLARITTALAAAKLEAIMVGNAAAALHGAPITTQDVDFFIRHTPRNLSKLKTFASRFGGVLVQPYDPVSRMQRVMTTEVAVDFVFELSSHKKFESVRSRATRVKIGNGAVWIASLEDIVAAKEAAGRPKDKATLPILKDTLRTKQKMEKTTA